jgi:hypothetical protein
VPLTSPPHTFPPLIDHQLFLNVFLAPLVTLVHEPSALCRQEARERGAGAAELVLAPQHDRTHSSSQPLPLLLCQGGTSAFRGQPPIKHKHPPKAKHALPASGRWAPQYLRAPQYPKRPLVPRPACSLVWIVIFIRWYGPVPLLPQHGAAGSHGLPGTAPRSAAFDSAKQ